MIPGLSGRPALRLVLQAAVPVAVVLGLSAVYAVLTDLPLAVLVRDAAAQGGLSPKHGALSVLTVLTWTAAGTAALVQALPQDWRASRTGQLVVGLGALAVVLGLDDQFLLHEGLLPRFGVPEKLLLGGYAVVTLALVWRARAELPVRPETPVLLLAGAALAGSLVVDTLQYSWPWSQGVRIYLEDGLKMLGAALLLRWAAVAGRDVSAPAQRRSSSRSR